MKHLHGIGRYKWAGDVLQCTGGGVVVTHEHYAIFHQGHELLLSIQHRRPAILPTDVCICCHYEEWMKLCAVTTIYSNKQGTEQMLPGHFCFHQEISWIWINVEIHNHQRFQKGTKPLLTMEMVGRNAKYVSNRPSMFIVHFSAQFEFTNYVTYILH